MATFEERLKKAKEIQALREAIGGDTSEERRLAREAFEKSEKTRDYAEIADLISQGLTKYGAARAGMKSGQDLSGIQTPGYDWGAARQRARQKFGSDLADIRAREREAKELEQEVRGLEEPASAPVQPEEPKAPSKKPKLDLTPIEKEIDKQFGKEAAQYIGKGGKAKADRNIKQLKEALNTLESGKDTLTGPVIGHMPDWLRSIAAPESLDLQGKVAGVVQQSLREILGGQFAEREGENLLKRSYDPTLEEGFNKKRIEDLLTQLQEAKKYKEKAIKYYNKNRTLKGFVPNEMTIEEAVVQHFEQGLQKKGLGAPRQDLSARDIVEEPQDPKIQDYADKYFKGDYGKAKALLEKRGYKSGQ